MFCNRATYTLLMIFISVNCWKYPLKSYYYRVACLCLSSHLGNSWTTFFPNGKHFRCEIFHMPNRNFFRKCVTGFRNGKQEVSQIGNTRFILVFSSTNSWLGWGTYPTLNQQAWPSRNALFWKKWNGWTKTCFAIGRHIHFLPYSIAKPMKNELRAKISQILIIFRKKSNLCSIRQVLLVYCLPYSKAKQI